MSALDSGFSIIHCIVGNTKLHSAGETGDAINSMTNLLVIFGLFGLLVALILLYSKSKTFRFRMKYFCYNFMMMVFAVYAACVGVFHPLDVENFHRISDNCYTLLIKLFSIRARIDGLEVFDSIKDKNFIIVANHQSSLDMFPILEATPPRTTFLAKKELLFAPLFGFAAWLFGVVFINRGHAKSARNVMEKTAKWIVEKKINLWIFPEGTRSQTGTLLPFKKGAFHLAQQAQIPIVPIVVYDYSSIFNKKNKIFSSGTMRGKVLPPVFMEGMTADEVSDITEHVRQKMLQVFLENKPSENITDEILRQDKKIQ